MVRHGETPTQAPRKLSNGWSSTTPAVAATWARAAHSSDEAAQVHQVRAEPPGQPTRRFKDPHKGRQRETEIEPREAPPQEKNSAYERWLDDRRFLLELRRSRLQLSSTTCIISTLASIVPTAPAKSAHNTRRRIRTRARQPASTAQRAGPNRAKAASPVPGTSGNTPDAPAAVQACPAGKLQYACPGYHQRKQRRDRQLVASWAKRPL